MEVSVFFGAAIIRISLGDYCDWSLTAIKTDHRRQLDRRVFWRGADFPSEVSVAGFEGFEASGFPVGCPHQGFQSGVSLWVFSLGFRHSRSPLTRGFRGRFLVAGFTEAVSRFCGFSGAWRFRVFLGAGRTRFQG